VFELTVPAGQRLPAPAHSHDHYEETIYGIDGALTWTVDGRQIPDRVETFLESLLVTHCAMSPVRQLIFSKEESVTCHFS
jgi:hypothetical protein